MKACFARNQDGAAALEFAIIAPVMITMAFGAIAAGIGFWIKNALQDVAEEAARCSAIGSSTCATVNSGCDSSNPAVCYAEQLAQQRGVPALTKTNISVNSNTAYAGASFTVVTINDTVTLAGYSYTFTASGSFPN